MPNVDLPGGFWSDQNDKLHDELVDALTRIALIGVDTSSDEFEGYGISLDDDMANERAAEWAETYTDELLQSIGTTSEDGVGKAISDWLQTPGATVGDLDAVLAAALDDNISRANAIAVTETTRAVTQGDMLAYDEAGIQMPPMWDDPVAGETRFGPPLHPNCRCDTAVVYVDGQWLVVWSTLRDPLVCPDPKVKNPHEYDTPVGTVTGCGDLDGVCISEGEHLGEMLKVAGGMLTMQKGAYIDAAAHTASTGTLNTRALPTSAQTHAGNYRKGHIVINGLQITIENPVGSTRKPGQPELNSHYGYIRGTMGADDDHVDCFVRVGTQDDYSGPVYVINQQDEDGNFDEHKCMIGWDNLQNAKAGYLANYPAGWKGVQSIFPMTMQAFKQWLKDGGKNEAVVAKVVTALALYKHLPGQHDQSEHGNRGDSDEKAAPKLTGNATSFSGGKQRDIAEQIHALATDAIKQSQVGHLVKTTEVVTPIEMRRRMKEYGIDGDVVGYQYKDAIVVRSDIDAKLAEATVLHEVAHAASKAYPSLQKGFLGYMQKEAPDELARMQRTQEKLGYPKSQLNDEIFAEMHAVASTPAGARWFPVASARINGGKK